VQDMGRKRSQPPHLIQGRFANDARTGNAFRPLRPGRGEDVRRASSTGTHVPDHASRRSGGLPHFLGVGMFRRDWQNRQSDVGNYLVHPLAIRERKRQLVQRRLDGDVPHRCRTEQQIVRRVGDGQRRRLWW